MCVYEAACVGGTIDQPNQGQSLLQPSLCSTGVATYSQVPEYGALYVLRFHTNMITFLLSLLCLVVQAPPAWADTLL